MLNQPVLAFILSLVGIILSFPFLHFVTDHYFMPSLDKIAMRLNMPSDIAGSTLMAIGSSTPELAIVLFAIFLPGSHIPLGIGTIVGSALFNLLVIVGIVMFMSKSRFIWQPLIRDLFFYALSVFLLIYFYWNGRIDVFEALSFILVYIIYIVVMYYWKKLLPYSDIERDLIENGTQLKANGFKLKSFDNLNKKLTGQLDRLDSLVKRKIPQLGNLYVSFFLSIGIITFLSWILTSSAITISKFAGINEVFIGLIIIAVGTSIPDLFSSLIVAKQGRSGMAINNAIGSNIFDILIGLGVPLLILIGISKEVVKVDRSNLIESFTLLFSSVVLLTVAFFLTKWRPKKIIGFLLIGFYITFIIFEIIKIVS